MRSLKYISIIAVVVIVTLYINRRLSPFYQFEGRIFGTYYHIKILTERTDPALPAKVRQVLDKVNHQMSVFDNNSEISRINRSQNTINLSPEMSYLLKIASRINKESGGAFDPTVGKLVELWGFGVNREQTIPQVAEIKNVLSYTGFDKLQFSPDFKQLHKKDPRTFMNLSAIAKGYGTDRVAELLLAEGYRHFIVEIGGEIRVAGFRDGKSKPWGIGVANPGSNGKNNQLTLDLSDIAVATSGDYRNFHYQNGHKYAHTISPQTGYPVESNLASVTVLATRCIEADAYATALMSMGEKQAFQMAEKLNLAVIFIIRDPQGGFISRYSTALKTSEGN